MNNDISRDSFLYILQRIFSYAEDSSKEARSHKNDLFCEGECLAFDKVMQVIENELEGLGIDLSESL